MQCRRGGPAACEGTETMAEREREELARRLARHREQPVGDIQEAEDYRTVSLRALANILDTTRSSARRWLREAGIKPIVIGRGRNGAIRYRWKEVKTWMESRERVE